MASIEIKVPDIGDFSEVTVIELLVKVGDAVKVEQSILTVESDKASMEIPCSHAGVIKNISVVLGDKIKEGSVVLTLEVAGSGAQEAPAAVDVQPVVVQQEVVAVMATPPTSVAVTTTGRIDVHVPDIGDFKDVAVIELLVKLGDVVKKDQSLMTVESEKAAMEIPCATAGKVLEIKVKLGDTVNIGDVIVVMEGANSVSAASEPTPLPAAAHAVASPMSTVAVMSPTAATIALVAIEVPAHVPQSNTLNLPHASPSVRKFARELGVPLSEVRGTGNKGRITELDIRQFTQSVMIGAVQTTAQQVMATTATKNGGNTNTATDGGGLGLLAWPKVDFAKFGTVERKEMGRIKKISGSNLHRNWVIIPHVTNHDDADITDLEAFRVQMNKENEKSGTKVTMLAFLIKACVSALKQFPEFNASLDSDGGIVYKRYFHIGFAADTPNGLMVPVIRDADQKGILQISQEMGELAKKARDGKLAPAEMTGGCFSISSLGGIGGRYFTPIVNAPEVAILGVCKSSIEPKWDGKTFQPRLMLPMSLSWDHRVIDGAAAARFNAHLGKILGDFRRILM